MYFFAFQLIGTVDDMALGAKQCKKCFQEIFSILKQYQGKIGEIRGIKQYHNKIGQIKAKKEEGGDQKIIPNDKSGSSLLNKWFAWFSPSHTLVFETHCERLYKIKGTLGFANTFTVLKTNIQKELADVYHEAFYVHCVLFPCIDKNKAQSKTLDERAKHHKNNLQHMMARLTLLAQGMVDTKDADLARLFWGTFADYRAYKHTGELVGFVRQDLVNHTHNDFDLIKKTLEGIFKGKDAGSHIKTALNLLYPDGDWLGLANRQGNNPYYNDLLDTLNEQLREFVEKEYEGEEEQRQLLLVMDLSSTELNKVLLCYILERNTGWNNEKVLTALKIYIENSEGTSAGACKHIAWIAEESYGAECALQFWKLLFNNNWHSEALQVASRVLCDNTEVIYSGISYLFSDDKKSMQKLNIWEKKWCELLFQDASHYTSAVETAFGKYFATKDSLPKEKVYKRIADEIAPKSVPFGFFNLTSVNNEKVIALHKLRDVIIGKMGSSLNIELKN